ncbi:MAG: condensation domain-containing protein, partial [Gemmataceae bacterium]
MAFLQYTSGSTATPRGVMLTHANLLHNSAVIAQGFDHPHDGTGRGVFWLPLHHDMGLIGGVLQPMFAGGPSVLMPPVAFLSSPLRWLKAISDLRATTSGAPNFAYEYCVRKISPEERVALDLRSWTLAFTGAEPIRADTLDRFAEAFAECGFRREAFYPCYGLAESTLMVTGSIKGRGPLILSVRKSDLEQGRAFVTLADDSAARRLVGCGRPMIGQSVVIADPATGERRPDGEIGEIWTAGASVAQGYWNQPEATERTFGARLADGSGPFLRTGDLGFLHDGELFVTGRLKDVLIIQGRNHYPQDIEATVEAAHVAIRPGCVAAFAVEIDGEERLAVAAELEREFRRSDPAPVLASVREAVAGQHGLEPFAVVLLRTGSIPMTSSGKVQRYACRDAFRESSFEEVARWTAETEPPTHTLEQQPTKELDRPAAIRVFLSEQVAPMIGVEPATVDVDKPLIALGLDSLTAAELKARVESRFGVSLPWSALLNETATIQALAEQLTRSTSDDRPAAVEHRDSKEWALSVNQRAMAFLQRLEPDSAGYVIPLALRIPGSLDDSALRRALQRLLDRHAALRVAIHTEVDPAVQDPAAHPEVDLAVTDASNWGPEILRSRLLDESHHAFDLTRDPLVRVRVFRDTTGDTLLLTIHHIVSDHRSLQILMADLAALYSAEVSSAPDALPELAHDYGDYVRWQAELLAGPEAERLWNFWSDQLSDELPVLQLPTDRARPPVRSSRGSSLELPLDADLAGKLQERAHAEGVTLFNLTLAALQTLLHRYSGQDDILVGVPVAARGRPEFESLVGYFVNMVPLRTNLTGDPPFRELLSQVRATVVQALQHQDFPFPLMVERLRTARDPGRNPLFQVAFALQRDNSPEQLPRLGDMVLEPVDIERRVANFDLDWTIHDDGRELRCAVQYSTDLFDAETVARLVGHFFMMLQSVAEDPSRRLSELPLIREHERRLVISEWNQTETSISTACVHRKFEDWAAREPGAPAVVQEDTVWTYGELNDRANRLAQRLRELGVGPEKVVALFGGRAPEAIAGMLAVLKAGGAYLPLDPALPRDRLAVVLDDARPHVVLTQRELHDRLPANRWETLFLDDA